MKLSWSDSSRFRLRLLLEGKGFRYPRFTSERTFPSLSSYTVPSKVYPRSGTYLNLQPSVPSTVPERSHSPDPGKPTREPLQTSRLVLFTSGVTSCPLDRYRTSGPGFVSITSSTSKCRTSSLPSPCPSNRSFKSFRQYSSPSSVKDTPGSPVSTDPFSVSLCLKKSN